MHKLVMAGAVAARCGTTAHIAESSKTGCTSTLASTSAAAPYASATRHSTLQLPAGGSQVVPVAMRAGPSGVARCWASVAYALSPLLDAASVVALTGRYEKEYMSGRSAASSAQFTALSDTRVDSATTGAGGL